MTWTSHLLLGLALVCAGCGDGGGGVADAGGTSGASMDGGSDARGLLDAPADAAPGEGAPDGDAGQGGDASGDAAAGDGGSDGGPLPICEADQDLGSAVGVGVAMGSTVGAENELVPGCVVSPSTAPEVVFRWRAPSGGRWVFDTLGSSFDTVLHVRDESCREFGCRDDGVIGVRQSRVELDLAAGTVVFLVVDGALSARGDYSLSIGTVSLAETQCADGIDNDRDGVYDCGDSDCRAVDPDRCVESACGDGVDNDGDRSPDCADPDCWEREPCIEQTCGDGIDNDGEEADVADVQDFGACDARLGAPVDRDVPSPLRSSESSTSRVAPAPVADADFPVPPSTSTRRSVALASAPVTGSTMGTDADTPSGPSRMMLSSRVSAVVAATVAGDTDRLLGLSGEERLPHRRLRSVAELEPPAQGAIARARQDIADRDSLRIEGSLSLEIEALAFGAQDVHTGELEAEGAPAAGRWAHDLDGPPRARPDAQIAQHGGRTGRAPIHDLYHRLGRACRARQELGLGRARSPERDPGGERHGSVVLAGAQGDDGARGERGQVHLVESPVGRRQGTIAPGGRAGAHVDGRVPSRKIAREIAHGRAGGAEGRAVGGPEEVGFTHTAFHRAA